VFGTSQNATLTRVFYPDLKRVARACIITLHLHREAEELNGARMADVRFFPYAFDLSTISYARVYCYYKKINMMKKFDYSKLGDMITIPQEL